MTRAEIDAAIRRHAETETLYDQPYEDNAPHPGDRPVHGREPVAAPHRLAPTRSRPGVARPESNPERRPTSRR